MGSTNCTECFTGIFNESKSEDHIQNNSTQQNDIINLNIIHFNDAYDINPTIEKDKNGNITAIQGGASRMKSFINILSPINPIVLFSGDFLFPSMMSTATNGEHMIPVFNQFGITCSCLGNHELDRGNDICTQLLSKLNYPTLNCNNLTPINATATGDSEHDKKLELQPLGGCVKSYVYKMNNNFNIGFIGLVGDWSFTIPIIPENGLVYLNFIDECQKMINELNAKNKIDMIIVLSHMRLPNDKLLASKVDGIDLIVSGHDHFNYFGMEEINKTMIIKSGTDFRNVSWIQISKKIQNNNNKINDIEMHLNKSLNQKTEIFKGKRYEFIIRYYNIDINIKPDPSMEQLVHELTDSFQKQVDQIIGYIAVPLDVTESVVRSKESAVGNFISDVVRRAYHCDAVFLYGGTLRANRIIPSGPITTKDLLDIDKFQNAMIVIKLKGSTIRKILEHSVAEDNNNGLHKMDGRFPQISGIRFVYDDKADSGNRVKAIWISKYKENEIKNTFSKSLQKLNNYDNDFDEEDNFALINDNEIYKISTTDYLFNGGLGFRWFKKETIEIVIDSESGLSMSVILRNFFWAIETVNKLLELKNDQKNNKQTKSVMNMFAIKPKRGNSSMLKLESINGNDDDSMFSNKLTVSPTIEHRIMKADENIDIGSDEFCSMQNFFAKLPSFVGMTKLPRQSSLLQILHDINETQTEQ